jgi:DNA-directed RNA polymerase specialized sigma24 family protein
MITAMSPIAQDATAETYQDIQKLIYKTIWKFLKTHEGDFDEMASVANFTFMRAYLSHDESRASFVTWFHIKMNKAFLELWRGNCRRALFNLPLEESTTTPGRPFIELLSELSHDAQTIVELLLELPESLQEDILKKGTHTLHVKPALRSYLKTFFGWNEKHIIETFREIAEVIND